MSEAITKIKVAIIEDDKEVAKVLQGLFNDELDMTCTQVYHNAEDAINFLVKNPPDVVLTDIGLPQANGIEAIVSIRELCPNIQFCMFTVFDDAARIFESIRAGAKGYILKHSSSEKIIEAIRDLHNGGAPMNPEIARKVITAFSETKPAVAKATHLPLTPREFELLEELSKGLLYKEIAVNLNITVGTVKQHIHKIYHKLQVNNRTEAINKYLSRG